MNNPTFLAASKDLITTPQQLSGFRRSTAIASACILGAFALAFTPLAVQAQLSPVKQTFGATPAEDANFTCTNGATSAPNNSPTSTTPIGSATLTTNVGGTQGSYEIGYFSSATPPVGAAAPQGTGCFGVLNANNGSALYTTQLDFAEKTFRVNSGPGPTDATRNKLIFALASYDTGGGAKGFNPSTNVRVLLSINGAPYVNALNIQGTNTSTDFFTFNSSAATSDHLANATITPAGFVTLTLPSSPTAQTKVAVRMTISTSDKSQILVRDVTLRSGNNSPLPVVLTRFSATPKAKGVNLNWATAMEKNSAYFEVQRSATGSEYETVGTQSAQGNSSRAHEYAFADSRPLNGLAYYRLRQVDIDGTASYSPVVSTRWAAWDGQLAYPNPSANTITLPAALGAVRYRISNTLGQTLLSGNAGTNGTVDLTTLPKGSYLLKLTGDAGSSTQRLVRE